MNITPTNQTPDQTPTPTPAPRKKHHPVRWILGGGAIVTAAVVIVSCGAMTKGVSEAIDSASAQSQATHVVTFKVTANGKASVNYGSTAGQSTTEIKEGTWTKKKTVTGWDAASVTVSGDVEGATKVTCEVLVDGKVKAHESGTGDGAIADCTASSID